MDNLSGSNEVRHMPSACSTICRRHSLGHRKGEGLVAQHQGTANSSEGTQAGSKLDKNLHDGNWQRDHQVYGRGRGAQCGECERGSVSGGEVQ